MQVKNNFYGMPSHAEFLDCLDGLKAAVQLGIRRVDLETDASLVKAAPEDTAMDDLTLKADTATDDLSLKSYSDRLL